MSLLKYDPSGAFFDHGGTTGLELASLGPQLEAARAEVLADADHPEHAELLEWAGPVDPEAFDAKHVGHGVECSLEPSGKILRGPWDR